jgi:hypothetical protein
MGARLFFISFGVFSVGWILQLALDTVYPIPLGVLDAYRPPGPAMALGLAFFFSVLFGLLLFVIGIVRILIGWFPSEH